MSNTLDLSNQVCDLIPVKRVSSVFGSANKTGRMLAVLLKSELENIRSAFDWRRNQITTTGSSPTPYTEILLPTDFDTMLTDSVWNGTTGYRILPLNDIDFIDIVNNPFKGISNLGNYYRVTQTNGIFKMQFAYEIESNVVINYTYKTSTTSLDSSSNPLITPTSDTDSPIYSDSLVRAALHKAMLLNMGMDAKYPIAEYSRLLNLAISKDTDSGIVTLHGGIRSPFLNIPETGYGA